MCESDFWKGTHTNSKCTQVSENVQIVYLILFGQGLVKSGTAFVLHAADKKNYIQTLYKAMKIPNIRL